jgi:hypothetical protein
MEGVMRRLLVIGLGVVVTFAAAPMMPANAEPGVIKSVFVEDSQGSMPVDDPIFTQCVGYEGQIFEDRHGVFNLTTHTRGSLAGVTHVEGDVSANFVISPLQGSGVVYAGTYREHDVGNFAGENLDIPYPSASFYLHATGTGTDGSQIRFTLRGHTVIDKRTGEVRRDASTATCRVS